MSDWAELGGLKRTSKNQNRYRYDPGTYRQDRNKFVPCKILFFCYMPGKDGVGFSPHALLRPCDVKRTKDDQDMDSVLFTRWRKEYDSNYKPTFVIMPLCTLFERVFVAEDDPAQYQQDVRKAWMGRKILGDTDHAYPPTNVPAKQSHDFCYVSHPVHLWPTKFQNTAPY